MSTLGIERRAQNAIREAREYSFASVNELTEHLVAAGHVVQIRKIDRSAYGATNLIWAECLQNGCEWGKMWEVNKTYYAVVKNAFTD